MSLNLVLASGSPRRRELLHQAGYDFRVVVPDESVELSVSRNLSPTEFVAEASFQKALAIAQSLSQSTVVAADTIADCQGQILGKPGNRKHAQQILETLHGKQHNVLTGVTIWNCANGKNITHVERTLLTMAKLSDQQLDGYLDSEQWVGKAGAFGYQDGCPWLTIDSGLASNVVGLPIERLPELLDRVQ